MKYLALFFLLSCGTIRQDLSPAPIEEGQKRVETLICGSHSVGENGCTFTEGSITGSLKIYKVYNGSVQIIGVGCGVDFSTNYTKDDQEWLTLDLRSLVGDRLDRDCVLTIIQKISYPVQRTEFPIKSLLGTVTLGFCPDGVNCDMSFSQTRLSNMSSILPFPEVHSGRYALYGCGQELIKPTSFTARPAVELKNFMPTTANSGCMFILGVSGGGLHKVYHKVWQYSDKVINMKLPAIQVGGRRTYFSGDESSLAYSVDGAMKLGANGNFYPKKEGNYIRFYTSQGRSLIVFIKDGGIVWSK